MAVSNWRGGGRSPTEIAEDNRYPMTLETIQNLIVKTILSSAVCIIALLRFQGVRDGNP